MRNCHILMINMISKRKIDNHSYLNYSYYDYTDLTDSVE